MTIEKVLYRAHAHVTGGRDGHATDPENNLDLKLTAPKKLGGGGGPRQEPRTALRRGSACFIDALKYVKAREKIALPNDVAIDDTVGIRQIPDGFGIEVELKISQRGMDRTEAPALIDKAHVVRPYSNATRNDIDVKLTLA
jgi:lipoyl-dependent peroxiredoxin